MDLLRNTYHLKKLLICNDLHVWPSARVGTIAGHRMIKIKINDFYCLDLGA